MLLLDNLERHVLAERHIAAVMIAAGAEGVTLPEFFEQRELFDASLIEPPRAAVVDSEQMQLRRALGVA